MCEGSINETKTICESRIKDRHTLLDVISSHLSVFMEISVNISKFQTQSRPSLSCASVLMRSYNKLHANTACKVL